MDGLTRHSLGREHQGESATRASDGREMDAAWIPTPRDGPMARVAALTRAIEA